MANGRPPIYETAEELQSRIDEYFRLLYVDDSDKNINEHFDKTPTITGLTLFLGFADRQSFYDYGKKDKFSCTIKRARMRVENWYEKCMLTGQAAGPIFALKNMGWKDKVETEHSGAIVQRIERKIVDPSD
jgi:hypothetical protein